MRGKLNNDEFENFLEEQVKNHRMYAADAVWRNIQNTLHARQSWHALTFASIFIIAALTAGTLLIKPNTNLLQSQYHPATQATIATSEKQNKVSTEILRQHLSTENLTKQTIAEAAHDLAFQQTTDASLQNTYSALIADASIAMLESGQNNKFPEKTKVDYNAQNVSAANNDETEEVTQQDQIVNISTNPLGAYSSFSFMKPEIPQNNNDVMFMNSFFPKTSYYANKNYPGYWFTLPAYSNDNEIKKASRLSYEIYTTPSVSYRRLYDVTTKHSPQTFVTALPVNTTGYTVDINKTVQHKPGLGLEAGFALGYKLMPQLTLKAGLQFNMRQYYIQTNDILNQPSNISNSMPLVDTAFENANRSSSNNSYITLTDRYYEISLPIGLEWKAVSLKKISIGVAGFIQPTYTFAKQPFIMTSDFKSYVNGSSLMRNWNINTAFETYFAYKTGTYTWQIGPQFRYQQLPTFNSQYPIREHLLDYGLKIGITKSIK